MKSGAYLLAAALLAGICGLARAGDMIEPGEMELYPTFSAVGIEIPYTGELQGLPEMVWRFFGEADWRNGVEMTVDPAKKFIWASIWPLEQGKTVEVRVAFKGHAPLDGRVTTRTMILEGGGRKYYVSPDGGNDNPGIKGLPFRTLAHAASIAKPGDMVFVRSGVYHEGGLFSNLHGEAGNPIVFMAAEGEEPVIDGSVTLEQGSDGWQDLGNGVWVTDLELNLDQARYAAQDGRRMFFYRSLDELEKDKVSAGRAWFYDEAAGKIYVKTGDVSAPGDHIYNVANFTCGVDLTGSEYVVVRGFEIRFFGETCVGVTDPSRGCVIYGNSLHNAPGAVNIRGYEVHDTAVWRNKMYETGLTDFTWNAIKASRYRRQGITCFSGRGSSICYNQVDGFFDCIDPEVWRLTERLDLNRDLDVMYNDLLNSGDDAIEADGGGVNFRIHGNRIRNCFAAISIAPVEKGPLYVTRNDATFYMIMYKLNVGGPESLGWAYVYHNSGYCLSHGEVYGGTAISFPPVRTMPIDNKVFKNNATICDGLGIRYGNERYDIDFNCYWNAPGQEPVSFRWEKPADGAWETVAYTSIEELRRETGRELHGMVADPRFRHTPALGAFRRGDYGSLPFSDFLASSDSSDADLRLDGASACLDSGVVIRGVNEDFEGEAPDIGAFETIK